MLLFWILQEKDTELVGMRLKDLEFVTELPAFLQVGNYISIPEGVKNVQFRFLQNGKEVPLYSLTVYTYVLEPNI